MRIILAGDGKRAFSPIVVAFCSLCDEEKGGLGGDRAGVPFYTSGFGLQGERLGAHF